MQKKHLVCDDDIQDEAMNQNGGGTEIASANDQGSATNPNPSSAPATDGKSANTKGANNGYGNGTNNSPGGSNSHISNNGNR